MATSGWRPSRQVHAATLWFVGSVMLSRIFLRLTVKGTCQRNCLVGIRPLRNN